MLILTRRVGEVINIGDEIEVTIMCTNGYEVKLGIEAPKNVPVHREEVYLRIKEKVVA